MKEHLSNMKKKQPLSLFYKIKEIETCEDNTNQLPVSQQLIKRLLVWELIKICKIIGLYFFLLSSYQKYTTYALFLNFTSFCALICIYGKYIAKICKCIFTYAIAYNSDSAYEYILISCSSIVGNMSHSLTTDYFMYLGFYGL